MYPRLLLSVAFALMFVNACAGTGQPGNAELAGTETVVVESDTLSAAFPTQLPADKLQPWESENRGSSATSPDSEFVPGREWFLASGEGVSEYGEAVNITSPAGEISYGIYRIPLAGAQPGTLSTDVNLLDDGSGAPSSYYLGLANYGSGRWEWHGPFSDGHVRLSYGDRIAAGGDFLSSAQSAFVCVLVHDGNAIDLIGLGLDAYDAGDTIGPAAPLGLAANPVAGGLELTWNAVAEADLAGYRIHYSNKSFINPGSAGVHDTGMLEGSTRFLLSGLAGRTYIRLSSVDKSGNSGPVSAIISALSLAGDAPSILLATDLVSGGIGSIANLSATGADSYDFDTDGDGIFEVTGNTSGTVTVDTSRTGIIRPRVRGTSSGGTAVALGAVSLIITGNSRPVAYATATPTFGDTPLAVSFSGVESMDFDGIIVGGGWDFDGDGGFNVWDDTDIVHVTSANATFTKPGVYNAKLRVVDDQGAWDVDTVTIIVGGNDPSNLKPVARLTADTTGGTIPLLVNFDASTSTDGDGSIVNYEWDFNGDGVYDGSGSSSTATHSYTYAGNLTCVLRVTDNGGAQHTTSFDISARSDTWVIQYLDIGNFIGHHTSMKIVDGYPAISYYDYLNGELRYIRATDPDGEDWGSPFVVDGSPEVGQYTSMEVVAGNPAIAYYDDRNEDLKYVRAADSQGASWSTPITVFTESAVGKYTSMVIVNGMPAISFYDESNTNLRYTRATDAIGSSWSYPLHVDNSGDMGIHSSMAIIDGNPAISYFDATNGYLRYVRAANVNGTLWSAPVVADSNDVTGLVSDLKAVNGKPAISHYQDSVKDTFFVRANDASGSTWGSSQKINKSGTITLEYVSMAIVDAFPAVCYSSIDGMMYVLAKDANGDDWEEPVDVDPDATGLFMSMEIVNGNPAISYYDTVSTSLKYARLY